MNKIVSNDIVIVCESRSSMFFCLACSSDRHTGGRHTRALKQFIPPDGFVFDEAVWQRLGKKQMPGIRKSS